MFAAASADAAPGVNSVIPVPAALLIPKVTTTEALAGATPTSAVRASAAAEATAISFLDL
jgi:hypothetical protein